MFDTITAKYVSGFYDELLQWRCCVYQSSRECHWRVDIFSSSGRHEVALESRSFPIQITDNLLDEFFLLQSEYSCDWSSQERETVTIKCKHREKKCEIYGRWMLEEDGSIIEPFNSIWNPIANEVRSIIQSDR
ncbi:hypothetical protein Pan258_31170 [Symmachiella dynata]|nr:hypothetical protein Pan258_31170 [Symmachiella dynata]